MLFGNSVRGSFFIAISRVYIKFIKNTQISLKNILKPLEKIHHVYYNNSKSGVKKSVKD